MQYGEMDRTGDDCHGKHSLLIPASKGGGMPSPTRPHRDAPETVRKERQDPFLWFLWEGTGVAGYVG